VVFVFPAVKEKNQLLADKLVQRLGRIFRQAEAALWGYADVGGLPRDELARFPRAVSLALSMDPQTMVTVSEGPNQTYADLYAAINQRLDEMAGRVVQTIITEGATERGQFLPRCETTR
jgi:hypothetical protein